MHISGCIPVYTCIYWYMVVIDICVDKKKGRGMRVICRK